MPDYSGSLAEFKSSGKDVPPTTYPEGFTPYPEGFTPYPKGFTPNTSAPKKKGRAKLNEDPGIVRRAQDEVKNLNSKLKGLKEAVPNNYYQPYDPEQVDWVSYVRIGNKMADIEKYLEGARKGVGKGPNRGK